MKYKFVGEGAGVPGLPHEITDEEAEMLGLKEFLAEAIRNGNYREAGAAVATPNVRKPKKAEEKE